MASQQLPLPRRVGVLYFWHISKSGGFGKVLILSNQELFFLHRKLIVSGEPIVGSPVEFTPAPPPQGKTDPAATFAVIDNAKRVRALDVPNTPKANVNVSKRALARRVRDDAA
jgi:hypothetical protein